MLIAVPSLMLTVLAMSIYQAVITYDPFTSAMQRARLLKQLSLGNDRHLILVKYGPHHSYSQEWVFNEADIDGSKVVWARAMDTQEDCELVQYFKDRKIWSLNIDHDEVLVQLKPFLRQSCE